MVAAPLKQTHTDTKIATMHSKRHRMQQKKRNDKRRENNQEDGRGGGEEGRAVREGKRE